MIGGLPHVMPRLGPAPSAPGHFALSRGRVAAPIQPVTATRLVLGDSGPLDQRRNPLVRQGDFCEIRQPHTLILGSHPSLCYT